MTASNGIRTEYKIKRLAAAVALAVAAMLGVSCLSPARADAAGTSDGNLVIDVPTTVPCALMADGTVVSPSEWKITTSGDAYIASASASGFPANVEWSARTTDLAAAQAGSVQLSGTGDAATVAGPSDPAAAKLAPSAGFEWAFSKLDAGKNSDIIGKAVGGTAVLGSVTFTFAKVEPVAFAVYSADDGSLTFYKRSAVPAAGDTFEGKTATEVYTGLETMTSIPGWTQNHFNDIKTVAVYDKGIAPTGTAFWFAGVRNLKTADVSKLDMSRCKTIECMFTDCISLETLDLSGWDTSSLTNMSQAFQHCASLTKLNVSGWDVSKVTNMQLVFAEDKALCSLDLSTWDNSATTSMKDAFLQMDSLNEISLGSKFKFVGTNGYLPTPSSTYIAGADGKWYDTDGNGYAPADIPSNKAMTYTAVAPKKAFAVYSADDDSLNLYKRADMPVAGQTFEGKTATEVYEGVEKTSYTAADGAPWSGHAAEIASVTVADEGVAPVSTAYWFKGASKLKSVSLAGLDTSQTTCMDSMFEGCSSLESLDLSAMSTRRVASMSAFLGGCDSLAELSLGSEFAWVDDDCYPPTGDWKQGSTGTDYSESDIPANKTDKYTRTKTAFAVYSADDQSLTFYKRFEAPAEGTQFLGKTATSVYKGIEDDALAYTSWTTKHQNDIASATVADEGIAPKSTAHWFYELGSLQSVDISKLDTHNVSSLDSMFYGCKSLTTLDLSSFDTTSVTSMRNLFMNCTALTSLDISSFDTSNVTAISYMFSNCESLTSLDLSSFDTTSVTRMSSVFTGCRNLTALDLSSFDTRNVTTIATLFKGCESLTTLDLSSFDTSNITGMGGVFMDCKSLTTLDLSSFDTRNVTDMALLFWNCDSLERIDLGAGFKWVGTYGYLPTPSSTYIAGADGKWYDTDGNGYAPADIPSNKAMTYTAVAPKKAFAVYSADDGSLSFYKRAGVPSAGNQFEGKTASKVYTGIESSSYTSSTQPWKDYRSSIKTVEVVDDGIMPSSCAYWFYGCSKMTNADVKKLDVSKANKLTSVFEMCSSLSSIEGLSGWNVSSATDVVQMFAFCSKLTSVGDLSNWDVSNVVKANGMFAFCSKLTSVGDLSNWDVSNVDTATMIFFKCSSIKTFGDLSRWNTSNMIYMQEMFECCSSLTSLGDLSGWDTSKAKTIRLMFDGCTSLTSLEGIGKWNTSNVEDSNGYAHMAGVFEDCSNITKLDLSNWSNAKTSPSTNSQMAVLPLFGGMTRLQQVTVGDKWEWKKSSIESWLLPTPSAAYITGADGKWYAKSTGIGYAPDQIPSFKADTYYASKDLLPKAFAVYSADDSSLNFYKRAGVPSAGEQFEGKTATAVFTGIETNEYYDDNPWCNYTDEIKTASVVDEGIAPVSTAYWFTSCKNLTTADLTKLDTSNVTRMTEMFHFCSSLAKLEGISSWNTSKVVSMSSMFDLCPLTSLDLSNWDTSNVEYMQSMFSSCSSLTSVGDISNWDTSKVTSISDMFTGCSSLKTLNLSNWDMSNVTKIDGIFFKCSSLTSVGDISGWNTSKVTLMQNMFNGCSKLSASCLNWDVSKVTNHRDFNRNAPGVTVPLAWQASSDEGVGDSMIAPLCEDRGNGNTLGVQSKNDNVEATGKTDGEPSADNEAWSSFKTSADDAGATKDASKGNPTLEGETSKESDATTEPESAEKAAMRKSGE